MAGRIQYLTAGAVVGVIVVSVVVLAILGAFGPQTTSHDGNVKQVLLVENFRGLNDSVDHGVPAASWPVIDVPRGTLVNITVFNADTQAHGFQVAHYFDGSIQTLSPGERIHVTFVANETGTFQISCPIPCTIHWAMQSGELVVS